MARAFSPKEIIAMDIPSLPFTGEWEEAFGRPGTTGVWIIWGDSGNGKSSFIMQLAKYLCNFGKVAYDSLEESRGLSLKKSLIRHKMDEVNGKFLVIDREPMDELSKRLLKRRSPDFVIIDSFQYSDLNYKKYKALKEKHLNKTLIFISHSEGDKPEGRAAKKVMFDADVKIYVRGFRAICKGRFIPSPGSYYTIWEEGAAHYWNR